MNRSYTIWAGKRLADMPGATGRHAQTFRRRIGGTQRDALAIARSIPVDDLHTLVTIDRYDGFDKLLREHKTTRVAKRLPDGTWIIGAAEVAAHDEQAKLARLAAAS